MRGTATARSRRSSKRLTEIAPNSNNVIGFHDPEADRDQGGNPPNFWDREHVWAEVARLDASQVGACDKDVRAKNQCLCLNGTRVAQVSDTLAIDLNLAAVGIARHPRTELCRQVGSSGLGQRLANSWRDRHYPNQKIDAASLVYTKALQIIRAFVEGAVIRSRRGRFLAIPTENAREKGTERQADQPAHVSRAWVRTAAVRASAGRAVAPGGGRLARLFRPTNRRAPRGFRRATYRARRNGQGLNTVVMFLLVLQVKLCKRLDVARVTNDLDGSVYA